MSKQTNLVNIIKSYESVLVAFSGGVDSSLLAKVAYETLGDKAIAVTVFSPFISDSEKSEADEMAQLIGIKHVTLFADPLQNPKVAQNDKLRCYYCKMDIFTKLKDYAKQNGFNVVLDGTNTDDLSDYRPGLTALKELEIASPLRFAEMSKQDVREMSKQYGLQTAVKPSAACLASRIPYGEPITVCALEQVAKAESTLRELGFVQFRVRHHGNVARLELDKDGLARVYSDSVLREKIVHHIKTAGFNFVAIDLEGFRSGSLNVTVE